MPQPRGPARLEQHAGLLFALALGIVHLVTIADVTTSDCVGASLAAWRIATTGAPWFDGFDFQAAIGRDVQSMDLMFFSPGADGHFVARRSPGVVVAGIPAYLLADLGGLPRDFHIWPASVTAALLATVTATLVLSYARRHLPLPTAVVATTVFALATPMWSVAADAMWTHTVTTLGLAGMLWAAGRDKWWLVGAFGGLALCGRLHVALVVAAVGLGVAWSRRSPRIAVSVGVVSACFMGLASLWSHWMYGTWAPTGGYQMGTYVDLAADRGVSGSLLNQIGVWVSPYSGILVWSPVLLLLGLAAARAWPQVPDHARWLALGGVLYTSLQVQLLDFTGGDAFYGYRLALELLVCLTPLALHSLGHLGPVARMLMGPVAMAQLFVISLGAATTGIWNVHGDPWRTNTFVDAARAFPALWGWLALGLALGALVRHRWPAAWTPRPASPARAGERAPALRH